MKMTKLLTLLKELSIAWLDWDDCALQDGGEVKERRKKEENARNVAVYRPSQEHLETPLPHGYPANLKQAFGIGTGTHVLRILSFCNVCIENPSF